MIRDYEPAGDADAVRACIVELQEYERAMEPSLPPGDAMADAYHRTILERCAKHAGRIFVAEIDGRVVGFAAVLGRVDPGAPDEEQVPHAYVSDLVVLPACRGRGLGRQLLERGEAFPRSPGVGVFQIGVLPRHQSAAGPFPAFRFGGFRVQMGARLW